MARIILMFVAWFTIERRRDLYRIALVVIPLLAAVNLIASEHIAAWSMLAQAILGLTAGVIATANAQARWRAWLYAIASALNVVLLALGVIPAATAPMLLALVAALLSFGGSGLGLAFISPDPVEPIDDNEEF